MFSHYIISEALTQLNKRCIVMSNGATKATLLPVIQHSDGKTTSS